MNVLVFNLIFSSIIFYMTYRWFLKPVMPQLRPEVLLLPLLLLQSLRHLGLMFLATGVTSPNIPMQFAIPAAFGDLAASVLAFCSAMLIQKNSRFAVPMMWIFSVVGVVDFISAITLSRIYHAGDFLGGAFWIPSFWVPMLLVAHLAIIDMLLLMKKNKLTLKTV